MFLCFIILKIQDLIASAKARSLVSPLMMDMGSLLNSFDFIISDCEIGLFSIRFKQELLNLDCTLIVSFEPQSSEGAISEKCAFEYEFSAAGF